MADANLSLLGVNLAGAEFGSVGQAYGTGYTYPTHAEIDYEAGKGMNVIRLPFLWERLQPTLGGALDPDELARIDDVVDYATSKGLTVDLDVHDYGNYNGQPIGGSAVTNANFADLWSRIAGHFASNPKVIFGLMNEPQQSSAAGWLTSANDAIAAIRQAGAGQEILVPGIGYDGAWTWTSGPNADTIGTGVVDPDHNYAFEVHQYLDSDGSGTHASAVSSTIGAERLAAITSWAESTGHHLFLGEFGTSSDATSLAALGNMLGYMSQHADVWQGGTYWAAGPWWGDYMYSAEPSGGTDAPQMKVLETYAPAAAQATATGSGATTAPSSSATTAPSGSAMTAPSGSATTAPSSSATTAPSGSATTASSGSATTASSGSATTASSGSATTAPSSGAATASSDSSAMGPSGGATTAAIASPAVTHPAPAVAAAAPPSGGATNAPQTTTGPAAPAVLLGSGATTAVVDPLANTVSTPAAAPAPSASFDPGIQVLGPTRVTLTGTVSDPNASVIILSDAGTLGAATVQADGTWSLTATVSGTASGLSAQAFGAGGTSVTPAPFSLTAGIRGRPYSIELVSSAADGSSTTMTELGQRGATIMKWTTTPNARGGLTDVYVESRGLLQMGLKNLTVVSDGDGNVTSETSTVLAGGTRDLASSGAVDHFVFQPAIGQDTIAGFTVGGPAHDTLVLPRSAFSNFADVLAATTQNGADAVIAAPNGRITLAGVAVADLRPQDVRFHG